MKNKLPFWLFLRRVGYYLSYPCPIWNGSTDTNWKYIDTQNEFTIDTAEQLARFAELVNKGYDFEGKKIKLGKDIVLNDIANMEDWDETQPKNVWTPIGTNKNAFKGIFDGCGHIISGVYTRNPNINNQGLFGCIETGQIINLWVIAFIMGNVSIGGFAGQSRGSIYNSYSAIILDGHSDVGGLVGTLQGKGKISKSRAVGVVKSSGVPRIGELVGNSNMSGEPLRCYGCSNGIVDRKSNAPICIEIKKFERDLFRQICKRLNQSPYRSSKIWSRYYCSKIDVKTEGNCIVINNLLRNADVEIYNKHNLSIMYSGNSGNSCSLRIPVQAGIYVLEVNKEKYPYLVKVE